MEHNGSDSDGQKPRRKLRALVITMPDSVRQKHIQDMFAHPSISQHFEPPIFTEAVSQRDLRNRFKCLQYCHKAGLVPDAEWEAIEQKHNDPEFMASKRDPKMFLDDCLKGVPVTPNRRGSKADVKLHYAMELWRKAKTINRGRAVLGCTLAHLIALKKWYPNNSDNDSGDDDEKFDMILEDNIRMSLTDGAHRIWEARQATLEWEEQNPNDGEQCHLRFLGWLGSIPNLQWILQRHRENRAFQRNNVVDATGTKESSYTIMPFPITQEIIKDLEENGWDTQPQEEDKASSNGETIHKEDDDNTRDEEEEGLDNAKIAKAHTKPGGTPVWGSYAYWMSREGYHALLHRLQTDIGSLFWKGKRGRFYNVKPADKVLPRALMDHFGSDTGAVQLTTYPAFFRAPMLTSKIHTQFDPEFCKSTEYQLQQCGHSWEDLWLTDDERAIVQHRELTGEWITLGQLKNTDLGDDDVVVPKGEDSP